MDQAGRFGGPFSFLVAEGRHGGFEDTSRRKSVFAARARPVQFYTLNTLGRK